MPKKRFRKIKRRRSKHWCRLKRLIPWKFLLYIASSTIFQGAQAPKQTVLQSTLRHLINSLWKIWQRNRK